MNAKRLTTNSIIAVFVFALYQHTVFAAGISAKMGLAQAKDAANKWMPNAVLVQVTTLTGHMDGTANKWSFLFYSPDAKSGYRWT